MTPGVVAWITGLPQSGKSTFARGVRAELERAGATAFVLDGDEVRSALVPPPGYSPQSRGRYYGTLARLAAMLARQGATVLVPATSHRAAYRRMARALSPRFVEVFIDAPAATCAKRDTKGLYRRRLAALPGVGVNYQRPTAPDVIASGGRDRAAVRATAALLKPRRRTR
jgi:adenylylsulfate kinase